MDFIVAFLDIIHAAQHSRFIYGGLVGYEMLVELKILLLVANPLVMQAMRSIIDIVINSNRSYL